MAEQIEATLDALASKLTTDLPAKLDALNAESGAIQLERPAAILAGVDEAHDYPRIFVIPDRTEQEWDAAGSIGWRHLIRVVSFVQDFETSVLWRKVVRYQRAIREVVLTNRGTATDGWYLIRYVEDEYGAVFRPNDEGQTDMPFIQGAATVFAIPQDQDIG